MKIIGRFGMLIRVSSETDLCRDKKDNFLLNLAIDSNADYLVTGDLDLLELEKIKKTKIITIQELRVKIK